MTAKNFGLAAGVVLWLTSACAFANHIVTENQKPGTTAWRLNNPGTDNASRIKGYTNRLSVAQGQNIRFHVSVNPSQQYSIRIYRMGYYQGRGGRQVWARNAINGTRKSSCPINASTGQTTCAWSSEVNLTIPSDWVTGIYLAKLTNAAGFDNHIPFLVTHNGPTPDLLYQQPVTTYHAYNNYPNDGSTGKSTYDYNSYGANTLLGKKRALRVSFDRPFADTGSFLYRLYEHELVMFLEERGYDLGYVTDIDTHRRPSVLNGIKGFISGGHDEYWTYEMRNAIDAARDGGTHLAFFGANAAFWQIRMKPDAAGRPNRIMEVYKDYSLDPEPNPVRKTVTFRSIGRAEQQLVGVQYIDYVDSQTRADFIARNTNHWIYEGTGVSDGFRIPGIIGGEMDKLFTNYSPPNSTEYTKIGRSPIQGATQGQVTAESVVYRAPSGAWVFGSGTLLWHLGLNDPATRSPVLRRMTQNLLDRYVGAGSGGTPTLSVTAADVVEGTGNIIVKFSLSNAASTPVTFKVSTVAVTATPGVDYYGRYQAVTLAPGVTSLDWPIQVVDDSQTEPRETLRVRIFQVSGASATTTSLTPGIIDDDQGGGPSLSISGAAASESQRSLTYTISLSAPVSQTVSFRFSTTNGSTATTGVDFYGTSSFVQIPPGQTSVTRKVTVVDDSITEGSETVRVQIFSAQNASVANRYAVATIQDDD